MRYLVAVIAILGGQASFLWAIFGGTNFRVESWPVFLGGIALANVRDRLRLLHDMQASFRAGVDQDHYRVRIDIPAEP